MQSILQSTARPRAGLLALLLASALTGEADAQSQVFRIEPAMTSAEFAVSHLGMSKQRGRFGQTNGTIALDTDAHTGSIQLVIDATSVDTGWGLRDAFIRGEDMFDTARFPVIRFESTQLVFDRTRLIGVVGMLTVRDVSRAVVLKVGRLDCGTSAADGREGCGAEVGTTIKRSDYGMNYALGLVGDEIDLSFQVTAFKQPADTALKP